ncbi:Glycoside hydrolase family 5 protein [Entamoeba marina]
MLKSIAFSNNAFNVLITEPITDHTLDDYAELEELGFNSARFYLSYLVFEDDDYPYNYLESGFEWLDSEVEVAKQNDIYLNCEENKEKLKTLWKEIASRYFNESIVVGYGLLNEPYVTNDSTPALKQWEDLMNVIADTIREVDDNHVLFVEPIIAYKIDGTNAEYPNYDFYVVGTHNWAADSTSSNSYDLDSQDFW